MKRLFALTIVCFLCLSCLIGCSKKEGPPEVIRQYPIDGLPGLVFADKFELDNQQSTDNKASARYESDGPITLRLFETGDIDFENGRLNFLVRIKLKGLTGDVYPEMWVVFKDKGEYFSKGLDQKLSGDVGWRVVQVPFFLKKGENPDNVKLNLVVEGKGTVWVDQVELIGHRYLN